MGGATAATPNASRRRIAVAVFALAALVGAASAAVARTPVETARERAARLGQQVVNAHASVSELQRRILSLASDVTAARRRLDHLQGRLVEAEHDLARARADVASVNARLNERARQAFMTSGPGASAAYLLEADSFADLMDRTVMLDSVQRADTLLGAEAAIESSEMAVRQASLERATRRRTALLAQIESNQADLLGAFAAQQDATPGSVRARIRIVPTDASATRSSRASTPSASPSSERSSAGERAATASTVPPRSETARLADSARAAARSTSGRPGARLDRVGDRVERGQFQSGRLALCRRGHFANGTAESRPRGAAQAVKRSQNQITAAPAATPMTRNPART